MSNIWNSQYNIYQNNKSAKEYKARYQISEERTKLLNKEVLKIPTVKLSRRNPKIYTASSLEMSPTL